jgi:hypothetical protein
LWRRRPLDLTFLQRFLVKNHCHPQELDAVRDAPQDDLGVFRGASVAVESQDLDFKRCKLDHARASLDAFQFDSVDAIRVYRSGQRSVAPRAVFACNREVPVSVANLARSQGPPYRTIYSIIGADVLVRY